MGSEGENMLQETTASQRRKLWVTFDEEEKNEVHEVRDSGNRRGSDESSSDTSSVTSLEDKDNDLIINDTKYKRSITTNDRYQPFKTINASSPCLNLKLDSSKIGDRYSVLRLLPPSPGSGEGLGWSSNINLGWSQQVRGQDKS